MKVLFKMSSANQRPFFVSVFSQASNNLLTIDGYRLGRGDCVIVVNGLQCASFGGFQGRWNRRTKRGEDRFGPHSSFMTRNRRRYRGYDDGCHTDWNGPALKLKNAVKPLSSKQPFCPLRRQTIKCGGIQSALYDCHRGRVVELTMGANGKDDTFLIGPLTVAMDDSVTTFGTRDPRNFQLQEHTLSQGYGVSGISGPGGGRQSLIATLAANGTLVSFIVPDRQPGEYCFSAACAGAAYCSLFGFSVVDVIGK